MTQAYSLRLPFTNVIIAATFAISMIIKYFYIITYYNIYICISHIKIQYSVLLFKKLRSILAAVQSPKLVLAFCEK